MLDGDWQMHLRVMEHSLGAEDGLYDDSKSKLRQVKTSQDHDLPADVL